MWSCIHSNNKLPCSEKIIFTFPNVLMWICGHSAQRALVRSGTKGQNGLVCNLHSILKMFGGVEVRTLCSPLNHLNINQANVGLYASLFAWGHNHTGSDNILHQLLPQLWMLKWLVQILKNIPDHYPFFITLYYLHYAFCYVVFSWHSPILDSSIRQPDS